MKRLIAMLMVLCLLLSSACAAPYKSGLPAICTAAEVDLSNVRLENGRLTGEIGLPQSAGNVRLLIDCPLPEGFAESQQQKLTVSYQKVTQDLLQSAIEAIGQSTEGGELRQFVSDPLTRMAEFELEKELSYAAVLPRDITGHARQAEMEAAKQILRKLAAALHLTLSEDFLSAQRNTFADLNRIHPGESSSAERLIARNERLFLAQEEMYGGRNGADDITLLRAMYEIAGLPVMNQRYWLQDGDAFGSSSELLAAVSDEGKLVLAEVWGVPVVEKQEAVEIPAKDWQTFLQEWVAAAYRPASHLEDTVEQSRTYGEIIHYGTYEVITRIAPCWVGRDQYTLEPGWYGVTETRLLGDGSPIWESLAYVTAVDMARIF